MNPIRSCLAFGRHRPGRCSPHRSGLRCVAVGVSLLFVASLARGEPVDVQVRKSGDVVIVDVKAKVRAAPDIVWDVLTDYDHMTGFVGTLGTSRVVSRRGDVLEVEQSGSAKFGMLTIPFESDRAVTLVDRREIRSRLVRGDLERSDFTTNVDPDGDDTVITNHGEYVPRGYVPPGLGPAVIRQQTEKQYGELIAEMLRRQAAKTKE